MNLKEQQYNKARELARQQLVVDGFGYVNMSGKTTEELVDIKATYLIEKNTLFKLQYELDVLFIQEETK